MDEILPPRLILEDRQPLLGMLRAGQELLLRNPGLAAALIQSLVAEGKQFSSTPQGERWTRRLESSELVQRGRMVWQACGLDNLLREGPGQLPTDWLNYVVDGLQSADLEETLTQLMMEDIYLGSLDTA